MFPEPLLEGRLLLIEPSPSSEFLTNINLTGFRCAKGVGHTEMISHRKLYFPRCYVSMHLKIKCYGVNCLPHITAITYVCWNFNLPYLRISKYDLIWKQYLYQNNHIKVRPLTYRKNEKATHLMGENICKSCMQ